MREEQKQDLARRLRSADATHVERLLWRRLQNRQLCNTKFRRQHPVGPYVVDFVSLEAKLALVAESAHA